MDAPISSPSQVAATSNASASSSSSSSLQTSPDQITSVPAPPSQDIKQPSTDAFLKDFTLVAEAAKRAQVAVMSYFLVFPSPSPATGDGNIGIVAQFSSHVSRTTPPIPLDLPPRDTATPETTAV